MQKKICSDGAEKLRDVTTHPTKSCSSQTAESVRVKARKRFSFSGASDAFSNKFRDPMRI